MCHLGAVLRSLPCCAAFYISSPLPSLSVSVHIVLSKMNYILAILVSLHCALRASANPIQPTITPPPLIPRQQDEELESDSRFLGYWFYPISGTSHLTPAMCDYDEFFTTSADIGTTYAACCYTSTFTSGSSSGSTLACSDQITTACEDATIAYYSDTWMTW